jgi:WD40 repeat protein
MYLNFLFYNEGGNIKLWKLFNVSNVVGLRASKRSWAEEEEEDSLTIPHRRHRNWTQRHLTQIHDDGINVGDVVRARRAAAMEAAATIATSNASSSTSAVSEPLNVDLMTSSTSQTPDPADRKSGSGRYELDFIKQFQTYSPVECMAVDEEADYIVVGGRGSRGLSLWSISNETQRLIKTLPQPWSHDSQSVHCVDAMSGKIVAGSHSVVHVWDGRSGQIVGTIVRPGMNVICVKLIREPRHGGTDYDNDNDALMALVVCSYGFIGIYKLNRSSQLSVVKSDHIKQSLPNQPKQPANLDNMFTDGVTCLITVNAPPGIMCANVLKCESGEDGWDITCGFKDANLRTWRILYQKSNVNNISREVSNGTLHSNSADGFVGTLNHHSHEGFENDVHHSWERLNNGSIINSVGEGSSNSIEGLERSDYNSVGEWTGLDEHGILTANQIATLSSLGDWVTQIWEDPISGVVVAGSWDGNIRVWDRKGNICSLKRVVSNNFKSAVLSLSVVGNIILSGNYDGSLVLYDFGSRLNVIKVF